MKKIIYTLTTLILLASCRSIDKMVESGNYDQALRFGVDKLRGKKNKKTKYVRGLEKAYAKLNSQDLNEIKHLRLSGRKNSQDRIVDIYKSMEKRQNYVMPLLPLISKDGYLADIKVVDYSTSIHKATQAAAEIHYSNAVNYLNTARKTGRKLEARDAYKALDDLEYYYYDYKDSQEMRNEAYQLGQSRILVEPYTGGSNIAFDHTLGIISEINTSQLNSMWEKFYVQDNNSITFDYIATIEVTDIVPGIERERINTYTETKKVKDGKVVLTDKSGKAVKDTSGNIIYTDKYKKVKAFVSEMEREKIAHMNGRVVIIDATNNIHIKSIPINITHGFNDYSCDYRGDKRALSDKTFKRIKSICEPFPSDYEITTTMAYAYKSAAEETLDKQNFQS